MGRKHFTEEQIAFALRQDDSGTVVAEIIRLAGHGQRARQRIRVEHIGHRRVVRRDFAGVR